MIILCSLISFLIIGLGFSLIITDTEEFAAIGLGIIVLGVAAGGIALSYMAVDNKEHGVKEYLEKPDTYQIDSISINGVFDHIEIDKL